MGRKNRKTRRVYKRSPEAVEIEGLLCQLKWNQQTNEDLTPKYDEQKHLVEPGTGKTGLKNVDTRCYLNTVIQTLKISDLFARQVIQRPLLRQEETRYHLRSLFLALQCSKAQWISAGNVYTKCKPTWFAFGQQDCSEYLQYLLTRLHQEELESDEKREKTLDSDAKEARSKCEQNVIGEKMGADSFSSSVKDNASASSRPSTLVSRCFGGILKWTSRCLVCQRESPREEAFTELTLHFPLEQRTPVPLPVPAQTLVGGGVEEPMESPEADFQRRSRPSVHTNPPQGGCNMPELPTNSDSQDENARMSESESLPKDSEQTISRNEILKTTSSGAIHLNELLRYAMRADKLSGENKYYCENCGKKQIGVRSLSIKDTPEYLILTINRFHFNVGNQEGSKIKREVICPRTLVLPVEKQSADKATESPIGSARKQEVVGFLCRKRPDVVPATSDTDLFGLCSVIIHAGSSVDSGHYYCFGRHSDTQTVMSRLVSERSLGCHSVGDDDLDFFEDDWFFFNDEWVSHTTFGEMSKQLERYPDHTPYVVVYRKLSLDDGDRQPPTEEVPLEEVLQETVTEEDEIVEEGRHRKNPETTPASETDTSRHWRDPDSDQGPPGSCGNGGELNTSGAGFVF